jgi:hypothetical protein
VIEPLPFETRRYRRERYAYALRIKRSRLDAWHAGVYGLKDRARIAAVMTRWLARCVRNQPHVIGTATVQIDRWWEERPRLVAVAPTYRDVAPEDAALLASMVDHERGQTVEVPA